jgi:ABC-type uncharacterized transport system substrate-binding protein
MLALPLLTGARLVIVSDGDSRPFQEAAAGAESSGIPSERYALADVRLAARVQKAGDDDVWIALGPRAAAWMVGVKSVHRAAALVRSNEIPTGLPGVSLEVPLEKQAQWLKTAFPGRRRLVVLRSAEFGAAQDAAITSAARAAGFTLSLGEAANAGEAVPALEAALRQGSGPALVWLLPDNRSITSDSVAPLIQEALSRRIPVVGFSPYFLRVGAVAAVSVDYAGLGKQAVVLAQSGQVLRQPPAPARLVVDEKLAQRLGVVVAGGDGVELRP